MFTLGKCSELWTSLTRIQRRCRFKYSRTGRENYLVIANNIAHIINELENKDVKDIDFNNLNIKKDNLYLNMRCLDE